MELGHMGTTESPQLATVSSHCKYFISASISSGPVVNACSETSLDRAFSGLIIHNGKGFSSESLLRCAVYFSFAVRTFCSCVTIKEGLGFPRCTRLHMAICIFLIFMTGIHLSLSPCVITTFEISHSFVLKKQMELSGKVIYLWIFYKLLAMDILYQGQKKLDW